MITKGKKVFLAVGVLGSILGGAAPALAATHRVVAGTFLVAVMQRPAGILAAALISRAAGTMRVARTLPALRILLRDFTDPRWASMAERSQVTRAFPTAAS
jgi:hypothetical protein